MSPDLDIQRLHRFLVEHEIPVFREDACQACGHLVTSGEAHAPDCEWVALVEMTKGRDEYGVHAIRYGAPIGDY